MMEKHPGLPKRILWGILFLLLVGALSVTFGQFLNKEHQTTEVILPASEENASATTTAIVGIATTSSVVEKVVQGVSKIVRVTPPPASALTSALAPLKWLPCDAMLATSSFYFDKDTQARKVYETLKSEGDSRASSIATLACTPQPIWLSRALTNDITGLVSEKLRRADATHKTAVVVIYNAPHHGEYVWGSGLPTGAEYVSWVNQVSLAIGSSSAWIILEPDLLGLSFEYSADDRTRAQKDIRDAVSLFKKNNPNVRVYLDAGHSDWKDASLVAPQLLAMGIAEANGFATNISNFRRTEDEITYAKKLSSLLNNTHFIIDTGRNGAGPAGGSEWCNPKGRAIGTFPTTETGIPLLDALLWIKNPGESDGTCAGGPGAGTFWIDEAVNMVKKALELAPKEGIVVAQ